MKRLMLLLALSLVVLPGCADQAPLLDPEAARPLAAAGGPHVVQVEPPTGILEEDRASILAALEAVRPGGTVQFARGTYRVGNPAPLSIDPIRVTVPRVTLLGHPAGTTLRGCEPEQLDFDNCLGLELTGGHQTVRNLAFEYMSSALDLGHYPLPGEPGEPSRIGGYRVEANTFLNSIFGVTVFGQWQQPAVLRNNRLVNVAEAIAVFGRTAHVIDNHLLVTDVELVPPFGRPFWAVISYTAHETLQTGPCDHNVISGNRVERYPDGLGVVVGDPGAGCRHNVIRDNTIVGSYPFRPDSDAGAGVFLWNFSEEPGLIVDNLVQGNRVEDVEGMGVMLYFAERNQVVNNSIHNVRLRDPAGWVGAGNGAGVWVTVGSDGNRILSNTFAEIASHAVVLEGDHNHVATRSASDVVRDLGVGNRVTGPGSVVTTAAPASTSVGAAGLLERRAMRGRMLEEVRRKAAPH